jgi:hypothetical protein
MSPFLRLDSAGIDDTLADGAVELLRKRGVDALNVAALARWMGISRQALSERLRGPDGARRRILQLTLLTFADRWIDWLAEAMFEDPPVPALPRTAEEEHGVRVWAALVELARGERASGNPDPAAGVVATVARERDLVHQRVSAWLGATPGDVDMVELYALTDGLRAALLEPVRTVSYDDARRILQRRLDALRLALPDSGAPHQNPDPQAA